MQRERDIVKRGGRPAFSSSSSLIRAGGVLAITDAAGSIAASIRVAGSGAGDRRAAHLGAEQGAQLTGDLRRRKRAGLRRLQVRRSPRPHLPIAARDSPTAPATFTVCT